MKHIKLFENFSYRKPKMITNQQYQQKFDTHGVEDFTTEQTDFLQVLIDNNKGWIYDYELKNNFVQIGYNLGPVLAGLAYSDGSDIGGVQTNDAKVLYLQLSTAF